MQHADCKYQYAVWTGIMKQWKIKSECPFQVHTLPLIKKSFPTPKLKQEHSGRLDGQKCTAFGDSSFQNLHRNRRADITPTINTSTPWYFLVEISKRERERREERRGEERRGEERRGEERRGEDRRGEGRRGETRSEERRREVRRGEERRGVERRGEERRGEERRGEERRGEERRGEERRGEERRGEEKPSGRIIL